MKVRRREVSSPPNSRNVKSDKIWIVGSQRVVGRRSDRESGVGRVRVGSRSNTRHMRGRDLITVVDQRESWENQGNSQKEFAIREVTKHPGG
jgi:hypothetical protein